MSAARAASERLSNWPQEPGAIRAHLDALVSGDIDEAAFLASVAARCAEESDLAWEVLSLLDQYYRRGKIPQAQFRRIKARIEACVFGVPTVPAAVAATGVAPGPAQARADAEAGAVREAAASPAPLNEASAAKEPSPTKETPPLKEPVAGVLLRGRYRLLAALASGAEGTLFEACDEDRLDATSGGRFVAVKVLPAAVRPDAPRLQQWRRRFQDLQSLSHPHIVRVHEFDHDGALAFFTMELLRGMPLSRLLASDAAAMLERAHALAIIRDAGAALEHAHAHGVIHGNFSPESVFITEDGDLRVLGFGTRESAMAAPGQTGFPALENLHLETRDDVHAFACVAYQLLTGRHPFEGRTAVEAHRLHMRLRRPPRLSHRQWRTLKAGLAWDRDRRPRGFRKWLVGFETHRVTARLPALPALTCPSGERSVGRLVARAVAVVSLVALLSITALLAASGAGVIPHYRFQPGNLATVQEYLATAPGQFVAAAQRWRSQALEQAHANPGARAAAPKPAAPDRPLIGSQGLTRASPAAVTAAGPASGPATDPAADSTPEPSAVPASVPAAVPAAEGQIELVATRFALSASKSVARVPVVRRGDLRGTLSFRWWTEPDSALPGDDYVAVEPQIAHFSDGQERLTLQIPLVSDVRRTEARRFYVLIGDAGTGATLGRRTRATVTLPRTR